MKLYKILEINGICININLPDTLTFHIRPNRYFGAIFREKEKSFCCQILYILLYCYDWLKRHLYEMSCNWRNHKTHSRIELQISWKKYASKS